MLTPDTVVHGKPSEWIAFLKRAQTPRWAMRVAEEEKWIETFLKPSPEVWDLIPVWEAA
jgi:hypothetical protein